MANCSNFRLSRVSIRTLVLPFLELEFLFVRIGAFGNDRVNFGDLNICYLNSLELDVKGPTTSISSGILFQVGCLVSIPLDGTCKWYLCVCLHYLVQGLNYL